MIQRLIRKLTNGAAIDHYAPPQGSCASGTESARVDRPHGISPAEWKGMVPRYRTRPLTCLADAAEIELGGGSRFAAEIPSNYWRRGMQRKWWEWDYLAKCAEELGVLHPGSIGVGLGVGDEPLIFYFANYCQKIIATDFYSSNTIWHEARFARAEEVYRSSPIAFPRERVDVHNADMRSLGIPDASVDFAWSCSSIEHVPTLCDLLQVFDELARVVKIGGYALLTTEFCLSQPPYLLPGLNALDGDLFVRWIEALGAFELVGITDLSYNSSHPGNAPRARGYWPARVEPGAPLQLPPAFRYGDSALMVGLSAIAPVAFVLRRRPGANATWAELSISEPVRAYSESVKQVQDRRVEGVVERLRPWVERGPEGQSLQFYHQLFRIRLEAMVHDGVSTQQDLLREIARFSQHLPSGVVQDADILDLVGYLLDSAGQHDEAARIFSLAMWSPSTCQDHAVSLALRYYRTMKRAGRLREALDDVAKLLANVAVGGMPLNQFLLAVENGQIDERLSAEDISRLHDAAGRKMSQSVKQFQTGLTRYLTPFESPSMATRMARRVVHARERLQAGIVGWWRARSRSA